LEEVFRDMIDALWADPDRLPESRAVLATLKRLLEAMFPTGPTLSILERQKIAERSAKAIYIHSHMDEESFDVARVMKCCVGVPEGAGSTPPTRSSTCPPPEKPPLSAPPRMLERRRAPRPAVHAREARP